LGRFFVLIGVAFFSPCTIADACHPNHYDHTANVKYVIDGDTVILNTDEKVRLIGIDAPELGHENKPDQPGAIQARQKLELLLRPDPRIHLQYGKQRNDRHGRTLAHIFTIKGDNIQKQLLADGLATPLTIPPNLSFQSCYQRAARQAQTHQRGLWALADYKITPVSKLSPEARGYRQIRGQVTHIGKTRASIWLNLGDAFAVRILREELVYFPEFKPEHLRGHTILVRGKVYKKKKQQHIRLFHPSDLSANPDQAGPK